MSKRFLGLKVVVIKFARELGPFNFQVKLMKIEDWVDVENV
jgi:hypothetical protein